MARSAFSVGSGSGSSSSSLNRAIPKVITPTRPIIMVMIMIILPQVLNWEVNSIDSPAVAKAEAASKNKLKKGLSCSQYVSQNTLDKSKMV